MSPCTMALNHLGYNSTFHNSTMLQTTKTTLVTGSSPVPMNLASKWYPFYSMKVASFGLNKCSASTTDCFCDPIKAG